MNKTMLIHEDETIYNTMTYASYADKRYFSDEELPRVKIQIDNLLRIGWPKSRILLATNFDFEYNGIRAIHLPDELIHFKEDKKRAMFAAKPSFLKYLLQNYIDPNESLLFHDQDAYQNFDKIEVPEEFGKYSMCLTAYNYNPYKINTGVWHLRPNNTVYEILDDVIEIQKEKNIYYEEKRLTEIVASKKYRNICVLGAEWNFGKHDIESTLAKIGQLPYFCHFKENKEKYMRYFRPILNPRLLSIIEEHHCAKSS